MCIRDRVVTVVMVAFFLPSRSPDVQLLLSDLNGDERRAIGEGDGIDAVSYTHLDVYKRQAERESWAGFSTTFR